MEIKNKELIKFKKLNNIFKSWEFGLSKSLSFKEFNQFNFKQKIYEYDKLKYISTIINSEIIHENGIIESNLNIKLCNDSFIYPPIQYLSNEKDCTPITWHKNSTDWYILNNELYEKDFKNILIWCEKYLNINNNNNKQHQEYYDQDDEIYLRIFYNPIYKKIEITMINKSILSSNNDGKYKSITISFEPGYPTMDYNQDWVKYKPFSKRN